MFLKGIRIFDGEKTMSLRDILIEVTYGKDLNWSILFLDGTPNKGEGEFLEQFEEKINNSIDGLRIDWLDLLAVSDKFFQMFEIIVLGCKDVSLLHRYTTEKEMYKTCDIVIDLIDCAFWEIYSTDQILIDRLKNKFKKIEYLEIT